MELGHFDKQSSITQKRKVPQCKISSFASWRPLKFELQVWNLTTDDDNQGIFHQNQSTFFQIPKKGRGELPPYTCLVPRLQLHFQSSPFLVILLRLLLILFLNLYMRQIKHGTFLFTLQFWDLFLPRVYYAYLFTCLCLLVEVLFFGISAVFFKYQDLLSKVNVHIFSLYIHTGKFWLPTKQYISFNENIQSIA